MGIDYITNDSAKLPDFYSENDVCKFPEIEILNYNFIQTTDSCPEQYEVFDKDGDHVCYVRLRWGCLTAEFPDLGGILIYKAKIGDGLTGCFESNEQRIAELKNIANRLDKELVRLGDFKTVNNGDYFEVAKSRL